MSPRTDSREIQQQLQALKRNDPTATSFASQPRHLPSSQEIRYGRRLGKALQNNTVVSKLTLDLVRILSKTDALHGSTKSATLLLEWIKQSASLRSVTLDAFRASRKLLPLMMEALTENRQIQEFHAHEPIPWHLVSNFALSNHRQLSVLKLDRQQLLEGEAAESAAVLASTADALSKLSTLKVLSLPGKDPFLRITIPALCATLTELTLNFKNEWHRAHAANAPLLSHALSTCTRLNRVEIHYLEAGDTDESSWAAIGTGFKSLPSIAQLDLIDCTFSKDSTACFLQDLTWMEQQEPQPLQQQQRQQRSPSGIHRLRLSRCRFVPSAAAEAATTTAVRQRRSPYGANNANMGAELARMLCGSGSGPGPASGPLCGRCLCHVRVDVDTTLGDVDGLERFFDFLTKHNQNSSVISSNVPLQTLQLDGIHGADVSLVLERMAMFLPHTVHLASLILELECADYGPIRTPYCYASMIPQIFVSSVRRNGSLHEVHFLDRYSNDRQAPYTFRTQEDRGKVRIINAYTERNRNVPLMLQRTVFEQLPHADRDAVEDSNVASTSAQVDAATPSPPSNMFPALCDVGMPAIQMVPKSLLIGLMAASTTDSLGPSHPSRKRRAET